MSLDSKQLLQDLKRQVRTLEDDLRQRAEAEQSINLNKAKKEKILANLRSTAERPCCS